MTYIDFHPGSSSKFDVLSMGQVNGQIDINSTYVGNKLTEEQRYKTSPMQDKLLIARARALKNKNLKGGYLYQLLPGQNGNNCKSFVKELCEGVCK